MYPHERSLVSRLADFPFAIVGVNSDSDRDMLAQTLKKEKITWRSFWNGPQGVDGPISRKWNVDGWPTLYLIDAEGKIRFKNVRGDELDAAIVELLAELGHEVDLSEPQQEVGDKNNDLENRGVDD